MRIEKLDELRNMCEELRPFHEHGNDEYSEMLCALTALARRVDMVSDKMFDIIFTELKDNLTYCKKHGKIVCKEFKEKYYEVEWE